jgi:hypothetical protein
MRYSSAGRAIAEMSRSTFDEVPMEPLKPNAPGLSPAIISVVCFVLVAATAPFNWIVLFQCWRLLDALYGSYFADNSGNLLYVLGSLAQTSLFALLWLPVFYKSRSKPCYIRSWLVVLLTFAYLAFWFGWIGFIIFQMWRTDRWV